MHLKSEAAELVMIFIDAKDGVFFHQQNQPITQGREG